MKKLSASLRNWLKENAKEILETPGEEMWCHLTENPVTGSIVAVWTKMKKVVRHGVVRVVFHATIKTSREVYKKIGNLLRRVTEIDLKEVSFTLPLKPVGNTAAN